MIISSLKCYLHDYNKYLFERNVVANLPCPATGQVANVALSRTRAAGGAVINVGHLQVTQL